MYGVKYPDSFSKFTESEKKATVDFVEYMINAYNSMDEQQKDYQLKLFYDALHSGLACAAAELGVSVETLLINLACAAAAVDHLEMMNESKAISRLAVYSGIRLSENVVRTKINSIIDNHYQEAYSDIIAISAKLPDMMRGNFLGFFMLICSYDGFINADEMNFLLNVLLPC